MSLIMSRRNGHSYLRLSDDAQAAFIAAARAAGREGFGVDISSLAQFVAQVKCTVFSEAELETMARWSDEATDAIDMHKPSCPNSDYAERGYYKHLDHPSRWRFRKAIEQALSSAIALGTPRLEAFGRCAVLRTAQWALDGRNKLPTIEEFRTCLRSTAKAMVVGARELRVSISENGRYPVTVLNRSAAGLE